MIYQAAETLAISLLLVLLLPLAASVAVHEVDLYVSPPTNTEQYTVRRRWVPDCQIPTFSL